MPGASLMGWRRRVLRRRVVQAVCYCTCRRASLRARSSSMSPPGQKSTDSNRGMRGFLLAVTCALCCALSLAAWAGRPVRVYEVDVDGKSAAALQAAMRQVLVRATGRRDAADDPALSAVVNDAPKYVQSYTTGPRGESQVVFDAAAVEQAIGAAGRRARPAGEPRTAAGGRRLGQSPQR